MNHLDAFVSEHFFMAVFIGACFWNGLYYFCLDFLDLLKKASKK